ncbi:Hypp8205 [Branchiostoma lanceolatum]|uniref:Hypp8205 protein n=1 Tax=Branchiostoma lanceolatum TaxID=7740 RepID=A0A8K0EEC8_BRALA|nr:Hypp8205 [Branchiostoma lanceolatum]
MVVKSGGLLTLMLSVMDEWWGLREYIAQNRHLSQEQLVKLLMTDATMAELLASVLMNLADKEEEDKFTKDVKSAAEEICQAGLFMM